MSGQEMVALGIVGLTAGAFVWRWWSRRRRGVLGGGGRGGGGDGGGGCGVGCIMTAGTGEKGKVEGYASVRVSGRKGERQRIEVRQARKRLEKSE